MWTFRSLGPALKKNGVLAVRANFRVKLFMGMMLVVSAITATALYFAQPGMNGDQMAAAIKRLAPRTPIILLTGFGLFYDKKDFPDVDVLASKPVRIPALRDAIAAATRSP